MSTTKPAQEETSAEQPDEVVIVAIAPDAPVVIPPAIAKALVAVQAGVTPLQKSAENPHFKNSYVPLSEAASEALRLITKHGLGITQWPVTEADRHFLITVLFHESGASISGKLELLMAQRTSQGQGSAITYARRYGIMSILGLVGEDDDDGNKASGRREPATPEQLAEIKQLCADLKFPLDQINARLQTVKSSDQAIVAIYNLNKMIQKKADQIDRDNQAESIAVFTEDDAEQADSIAENLQKQLLDLDRPLDWKRQLCRRVTGKPFIKNLKPSELTKLAEVIDGVRDGSFEEPPEWSEPEVVPPEVAA